MGDTTIFSGSVVRVLVPLALPTMLDYRLTDAAGAPCVGVPGDWVDVQVGKKHVHGVVADVLESSPFSNLKQARLAEVPRLSPATLAFYRWVARYTLSAPGEPLRVALPRGVVPPVPRVPKAKKPKKGAVAEVDVGMSGCQDARSNAVGVHLNAAQRVAADAVRGALGTFVPFLLDGVTGSGKTEVYFDVMREVLSRGQTVLVLVPEIALTPQWLKRFEERFGEKPLVWHSGLADGQRRATWWGLQQEARGRVVVGARSALFLPFRNLGLLVVDEEHEPSYKQEEAFRYHARDMAVQLGNLWKCPVILASATPSLESWQRACEKKYTRLVLPDRVGMAGMARIAMIDLRQEPKGDKGNFISQPLRAAMADTLMRGEQVLLFLNRRGNAPVLICRDCGTRRDCPRCDATLVVHGDKLQCHHCGYTEAFPDECPTCGGGNMKAYGPGTRRVVAEAQKLFPDARIAVADSDALTSPRMLGDMVRAMEAREVDIVVGTQMVTKGHHFPHLTCVGVIDADMGLAHGDLRAAERTFQLLTQVAGRAGRGERAGTVHVQSFDPSQPLFDALVRADRDGFYALELAARKAWGDPPFGRLVAVIVDGLDEHAVVEGTRALAGAFAKLAGGQQVRLMGPAPAPVAKIRDRYRWRLLVKGQGALQGLVKGWVEETAVPAGVRVTVDVDPVSFM